MMTPTNRAPLRRANAARLVRMRPRQTERDGNGILKQVIEFD